MNRLLPLILVVSAIHLQAIAYGDSPSEESPRSVRGATPLGLHGVTRPMLQAELRAVIPGTIAQVHVQEGQVVRKGDALVTLDDRLARARLLAAEIVAESAGELAHAKSRLRQAERQLGRMESLHANNATSDAELEAQRALVEQTRAIVATKIEAGKLAEAHRLLAAEEVRRMTISAPFAGVVTQLHVKLGAGIERTDPVVSVADLTVLEVEMHTPMSLFGSLQVGSQIELLAGAPLEERVTAKVIFLSPIINSASGTFRTILHIENNKRRLPAGFCVMFQPP